MACFTLPPEMIGFYKSHIDFINDHAVDPDNRRYSNKEEPPRHYLDADHYGEHPFDSIPEKWDDAIMIDVDKMPWSFSRIGISPLIGINSMRGEVIDMFFIKSKKLRRQCKTSHSIY